MSPKYNFEISSSTSYEYNSILNVLALSKETLKSV